MRFRYGGKGGFQVPSFLGHLALSRDSVQFWMSLGLLPRETLAREAVSRLVLVGGRRGRHTPVAFQLKSGRFYPVLFAPSKRLLRAARVLGWPVEDTARVAFRDVWFPHQFGFE